MDRGAKRHIGELMAAAGATMVIFQVAVFNVHALAVGTAVFFAGVEVYLYHREHHEDAVELDEPAATSES